MTNSLPFSLQNIQNALSLSDSNNDFREQLQQVNQPAFFKDEKRKVEKIKSLLQSGQHEVALKELLRDFANEDGIKYFNRIRQNDSSSSYPESKSREKVEIVSTQSNDGNNLKSWSYTNCLSSRTPSQVKRINAIPHVVGKVEVHPTNHYIVSIEKCFIHGKYSQTFVGRQKR